MKIARFYRAYPELALFPDDKSRIVALNLRQSRMLRGYRFWLGLGVYFLLMNAAMWATRPLLRLFTPGSVPGLLIIFSIGMVTIVGLGFGLQALWRGPIRRSLREELVSRGIPICLHCGYDLRGQTEPRCPECGRAFERMPGNP